MGANIELFDLHDYNFRYLVLYVAVCRRWCVLRGIPEGMSAICIAGYCRVIKLGLLCWKSKYYLSVDGIWYRGRLGYFMNAQLASP